MSKRGGGGEEGRRGKGDGQGGWARKGMKRGRRSRKME